MKATLAELSRELENLLRLKTRVIGFKLLKKKDDLQSIPNIQKMPQNVSFCRNITYCRTTGIPVGVTLDNMRVTCSTVFGLRKVPEEGRDGTVYMGTWVKTREDAKKRMDAIPRIPVVGNEAILLAPVAELDLKPQVILVYGTPAQIFFIVNALQLTDYEVLHFYSVGETSCSDALVRCYLTKKPALTIPCYGERVLGYAADDEIVIALPPNTLQKVVDNIKELYKRGLTYPTSYKGMRPDALNDMHPAYRNTWLDPQWKKYSTNPP